MRHTLSRWLASVSRALLLVALLGVPVLLPLRAAERPRYGGTLRIQMQATIESLDPAAEAGDSAASAARGKLSVLVFDRLIELDDNGGLQPGLALSWEPGLEFRRWQFRLRPGVRFHDGTELTPSLAAEAVRTFAGVAAVRVFGETLIVELAGADPHLPYRLAQADRPIFYRDADGAVHGSGPFRLAEWEPGKRAVLMANDDYRVGRPFLDRIEVELGRAPRDQWIALELGQADLVEAAPEPARRTAAGGPRVWASASVRVVRLVFASTPRGEDAALREALALSVDRASLHAVLARGGGEVAAGLLPQWLSGYAALFAAQRNLERARELAGQFNAPRLTLAYPADDALLRAIAERIAVNAREAGLAVRPAAFSGATPPAEADVILSAGRVTSPGVECALVQMTSGIIRLEKAPRDLEQSFLTEREVLASFRVVPLLYLPESYGLSARLRGWRAMRWGDWRLADVWLAAESRQGGEAR
jgi:ABC-type transport system substrate-binding protein